MLRLGWVGSDAVRCRVVYLINAGMIRGMTSGGSAKKNTRANPGAPALKEDTAESLH